MQTFSRQLIARKMQDLMQTSHNHTRASCATSKPPSIAAAMATSKRAVLQIPVSVGELVDKLTILSLKQIHLRGDALEHVNQEHQLLQQIFLTVSEQVPAELSNELQVVNAKLWQIEEDIRSCDRRNDFGPTFIELAKNVYRLNNHRSNIKRAINIASGSLLIEEKTYAGGSEDVRPIT